MAGHNRTILPKRTHPPAEQIHITGRLVDDDDNGLDGITVVAKYPAGSGKPDLHSKTGAGGAAGDFRLGPVDRGTDLTVELPMNAPSGDRLYALKGSPRFTVTADSTSPSLGTFTYVAMGAQISGQVKREVDIDDPTKDLPFAGIKVFLLDQYGVSRDETETNSRGEFSFPVVADGVYELRFHPEKSVGNERLKLGTTQPATRFVSARAGWTLKEPVRFTLEQSEIFGLITADGQGLDGVPVSLYDAATGSQVPLYDATTGTQVPSIPTQASGRYRLEKLRAGRFVLKFPAQHTDQTGRRWELEQNQQEQTLDMVQPGVFPAKPVNYQPEEHLIYGTATWSDGQSAANVTLVVSDAAHILPERQVVTDEHGYYECEVGRAGKFFVKADTTQGQLFSVTVNSRREYNIVIDRPAGGASGGGGGKLPSNFDDLTAYPLLTGSVGPSSAPQPGTSGGLASGSLGLLVEGAIQQVLGWKPKPDDPKAFVGALTQSFIPVEEQGAVRWEWKPRTYAVHTDLSGGITGAQASLYSRARVAIDEATPLLEGLKPLRIDVDTENVESLRALLASQMAELIGEIGTPGGPRVIRVDQIFVGLLGRQATKSDADSVGGQLGLLRDILGMTPDLVNTVEEEQNLTNFRILVDYLASLHRSWEDNRQYFARTAPNPFFGTQLVLLSRQLSVVAESVDELRRALDSVFVGPAERQTLRIELPNVSNGVVAPSSGSPGAIEMFLEELLSWVHDFASDEGPRIIQEGGKYGVESTFQPIVTTLRDLVRAAKNPANCDIPTGYKTPRAQRAFQELVDHLERLLKLASTIKKTI